MIWKRCWSIPFNFEEFSTKMSGASWWSYCSIVFPWHLTLFVLPDLADPLIIVHAIFLCFCLCALVVISFWTDAVCIPETIVGIHLHCNQGGLHIEDLGSSREPLDIMLVETWIIVWFYMHVVNSLPFHPPSLIRVRASTYLSELWVWVWIFLSVTRIRSSLITWHLDFFIFPCKFGIASLSCWWMLRLILG